MLGTDAIVGCGGEDEGLGVLYVGLELVIGRYLLEKGALGGNGDGSVLADPAGSGGDVFEIIGPLVKMDTKGLTAFTRMTGELVKSMRACPQPIIAAVEGICAGAGAIIIIGTLLARAHWLTFLRFFGEHSIVIYLAFFLPMATSRTLLLKTGLIHDIGAVSLLVTVAGVIGALAIWWIALKFGANFLFERPAAFWIAPKKPRKTLQAAE